MNLASAAGWAAKPAISAFAGQRSAPGEGGLRSHRDFWNDWPVYLAEKMNKARARRRADLAAIQSAAQARERVATVRSKVWELIGGPLEKTPLNVRTTGSIDRGPYRIEKVIFESLPKVYVTANLYIPASGTPPFPAILSPLGHTEDGKAYRSYQYVFQDLARRGYVVLAFDPYGQGERLQYINPETGRSRYGPTGEHDQAGRPLLLLGDTFALYRVWDGIRALDYLLSRPEVDSHRVGCTGHSGGGTMTMYLAALEPRIQVTVEVEGNSENVAGPFYDPPGAAADAEQNLVGSLSVGLDRGDLLWAFAPKPLLLCYTTHDEGETYSPVYEEATRAIYEELQRVYGLLEAREKVGIFASHLPHDFDFFQRRAACQWFDRWLANTKAATGEAEFDASPRGSLNCTSTGQVLTSLGGRSVVQVNSDRARQIMPESPFRNASAASAPIHQEIREGLVSLLALPRRRTSLRPEILSSQERKGVVIDEFHFESEPGVRIPGWFVRSSGAPTPCPTVVYVSDSGGNRVVREPGSMDRLLAAGHAVCAISLRGLGIGAPRFPRGGPRFYGDTAAITEMFSWVSLSLGQPVIGQRVWDTLRAFDYLASRTEVRPSHIYLLGSGSAGLAALLAAVLDHRPRSILLEGTLVSYLSMVEAQEYSLALGWIVPGMLRKFDLPDLTAALSPRPCWMLNTVDPSGHVLGEASLRERYGQRINMRAPLFESLRFLAAPEREAEEIYLNWLEAT